jgi:hypothetical protein
LQLLLSVVRRVALLQIKLLPSSADAESAVPAAAASC